MHQRQSSAALVPSQDMDEEMTSPEVTPTGGFNRKKFLWGILFGVGGAVIVLAIIFSILFYTQPVLAPMVDRLAQWVNMPIGSVNGQLIGYRAFHEDYTIIVHYYTNGVAQGALSAADVPSDAELRANIVSQLVNKALIDHLAGTYGLVVSDIEVETAWQKEVLPSFASADEAATAISTAYGMSVEQFKAKVVRDNLLVNKLSESIGFDDALQAEVKKKADEVLAAVSAGDKSFEDLAKQYSEDTTTAAQGGDLGWFGRGVMVAEFEQAAFALSPGETSQLVKTIFGYHIIKVLEKKEPSADGAQPEEVRAEHILIKGFDLNSYLAKAKDGNQVKKYVKFAGTE